MKINYTLTKEDLKKKKERKNKHETDILKIIDLCEDEFKIYKKRAYINDIIDYQGGTGLVFEMLQNMYYSGKYKYPTIYKYRHELIKYYRQFINERMQAWKMVKRYK